MPHRTSKGPGPTNHPNTVSNQVASPGVVLPLQTITQGRPNQDPSQGHGCVVNSFVGMCANKVATAYHLIGTAVRGYVAQSTGRIGLDLTKTIRNRITKANESYSLYIWVDFL
jgi:hypothetical protein